MRSPCAHKAQNAVGMKGVIVKFFLDTADLAEIEEAVQVYGKFIESFAYGRNTVE